MRANGKLNLQEQNIKHLFEDVKSLEDKLVHRPTHEELAKLIHFMQTSLESRLDSISARLTQLDERIDTILSRK